MSDPYNLRRFVDAQQGTFEVALAEIRRGSKRTHWMWFVFPQSAGLGHSSMAREFAIGSVAEAAAYLDHPVLGPRLRTCVGALQDLGYGTAREIFGDVDAVKLRSSLTLFEAASRDPIFAAALERWFGGARDERTIALVTKVER